MSRPGPRSSPVPRTRTAVPSTGWTADAPCALAIAAARPEDVAQAALMCGISLRTAPASATHTYIEAVPDLKPAKRSVLSTEDRLTTAADNFTTGEKWPTLVLRRTPTCPAWHNVQLGRPLRLHHDLRPEERHDRRHAASKLAGADASNYAFERILQRGKDAAAADTAAT